MRIHRIWLTKKWWQKLKYPRKKGVPLTEVGETQEQGYPWRTGRCRVFRIPMTRHAVAVGEWTGYQPRETIYGEPSLSFKPLDNWKDYVHVQEDSDRGTDLSL